MAANAQLPRPLKHYTGRLCVVVNNWRHDIHIASRLNWADVFLGFVMFHVPLESNRLPYRAGQGSVASSLVYDVERPKFVFCHFNLQEGCCVAERDHMHGV